MKLTFSRRTSRVDDAMRKEIRGRMHFALSRFSRLIDEVMIQIADIVGARGSLQRLCRLSVRLKRLGSFSIESVEDDVAIAVSRAAERAAKQLQRILDQRHDETRRV